jgi:hypothetical protein
MATRKDSPPQNRGGARHRQPPPSTVQRLRTSGAIAAASSTGVATAALLGLELAGMLGQTAAPASVALSPVLTADTSTATTSSAAAVPLSSASVRGSGYFPGCGCGGFAQFNTDPTGQYFGMVTLGAGFGIGGVFSGGLGAPVTPGYGIQGRIATPNYTFSGQSDVANGTLSGLITRDAAGNAVGVGASYGPNGLALQERLGAYNVALGSEASVNGYVTFGIPKPSAATVNEMMKSQAAAGYLEMGLPVPPELQPGTATAPQPPATQPTSPSPVAQDFAALNQQANPLAGPTVASTMNQYLSPGDTTGLAPSGTASTGTTSNGASFADRFAATWGQQPVASSFLNTVNPATPNQYPATAPVGSPAMTPGMDTLGVANQYLNGTAPTTTSGTTFADRFAPALQTTPGQPTVPSLPPADTTTPATGMDTTAVANQYMNSLAGNPTSTAGPTPSDTTGTGTSFADRFAPALQPNPGQPTVPNPSDPAYSLMPAAPAPITPAPGPSGAVTPADAGAAPTSTAAADTSTAAADTTATVAPVADTAPAPVVDSTATQAAPVDTSPTLVAAADTSYDPGASFGGGTSSGGGGASSG